MMRLAFDIETDGLIATKVHSLVAKDIDSGELYSHHHQTIGEGVKLLEQADVLIGHNIICYDLPTLARLFPDFKPRGTARDTLVLARLIWTDVQNQDFRRRDQGSAFPPQLIGKHSLKAWGYRIGVTKGTFSHEQTDWSRWTPEMQAYCEQDVEVTAALWKLIQKQNYSEEAVRLEHQFQTLIHEQEKFGFPFDTQAATRLYAELVELRTELLAKLQAVVPPRRIEQKTPQYWEDAFGVRYQTKGAARQAKASGLTPGPNKFKLIPFNPGSPDQAIAFFKTKGWEPTYFTDNGNPQFDEEVIKKIPHPEAALLMDYLLVQKRIGQIAEGDKAWLRYDKGGRIHGEMITAGTVTGRCIHLNPNIGQVPKVQKNKQGILIGPEGGWGWECRSLFHAEPGMVLVGWDASSLELRCLSHYMARYDNGDYGRIVCDPNGDIHTVNQKAAKIDTRDHAKTWIYSYLYGAGDELLGENAGRVSREEIDLYRRTLSYLWNRHHGYLVKKNRKPDPATIATCIKGALLRQQFEKGLPAIGSLKAAITTAVREKGYLLAIDGRRLMLRSAHSALNFLLQSCGSILVKKATCILHDKLHARGWTHGREWKQHAHVHDEAQASVLPHLADEYGQTAIESIREAGEYFKLRIPLTGEYKIGPHWASTH